MMLRMNLREAIRSLLASKQRTLLALLGIVIGIASVIAMVSVGTIVQREAMAQFVELGTDILRVNNLGLEYGPRNRWFGLKAAEALKLASPELQHFAPFTSGSGVIKYRASQWTVPIISSTSELSTICKLKLTAGRLLTPLDEGMYNCVIGAKLAADLAAAGIANPVGKGVLVMQNNFTIVGVLDRMPPSTMRPDEINDGLMVPYRTMVAMSGKDVVQFALARMRPEGDYLKAIDQVKGFIRRAFPIHDPQIISAEELIVQMNRQMTMYTLLLGVIGSISLLVGGVGVMNIMLVSVTERRREIGIRRAIGAQQSDIQWQFLLEAVVLCAFGGVLGIGFGVGSAYLIARYSAWNFAVSWMAVGLGGGVSVGVGVFFGLYPAVQASRMNPIEALRSS